MPSQIPSARHLRSSPVIAHPSLPNAISINRSYCLLKTIGSSLPQISSDFPQVQFYSIQISTLVVLFKCIKKQQNNPINSNGESHGKGFKLKSSKKEKKKKTEIKRGEKKKKKNRLQ
ncbi:hypothetical protein LXL04_017014 [Taraxacum kok-saghyz]